jgi:hypothetical protein
VGRRRRERESAVKPESLALPLLFVLLVAALLRFHDLGGVPPGLFEDEARNGVDFLEAIESGRWAVFYPDNNGREGLFINIQGLWIKTLMAFSGSPDFLPETWMLRFPSAVFGTLTVLGLFFLARESSGGGVAGLAAALMAASGFWHVHFSRLGFRAILAPFFLVWAVCLLLRAFRLGADAGAWRRAARFAAAGALYGLGFHSYTAYRVTPVVVLFVLGYEFFRCRARQKMAAWASGTAIFAAAALAAAAPLALYFLSHPGSFSGRTGQLSVVGSPGWGNKLAKNLLDTLLMFHLQGDRNWRHNVSGQPELFLPVGLLFLAGLACSVPVLRRKAGGGGGLVYSLACVWLAAAAVPVIFSNEGVPHAMRGILLIPPCYLLAGAAAGRLYGWIANRYSPAAANFAAAAFAALVIVEGYQTYFRLYAVEPKVAEAFEAQFAGAAREINAAPRTAPKYILAIRAKVDRHGIPEPLWATAVLTRSVTERERQFRNIRYVTSREEAERVARDPAAMLFAVR